MQTSSWLSQSRRQRWLVLAFFGLALLLIGLHLYVLTLPTSVGAIPEAGEAEAHWWGFWPVRYPSVWIVWLGVGAVMGSLLWGLRRITSVRFADGVNEVNNPSSPADLTGLVILALLLIGDFFAFPVVHTRWGDAYIIANAMAWPDPALRLTHSWQAPLDVFLHSQIWLALHARFGWSDATPVYRLLSPLAGMLYLAVVLRLGRMKALAPAWLTFGLLTSLGVVQLFFGYVENYSFAAAGILAYLWIGLKVLEGRRPLWLAASVLALLNATHPSTIVLAPSLLYIVWQQWRDGHIPVRRGLLEVALPVALVAGGTLWLMEAGGHGLAALFGADRPGGGDGRWLVPLFATTTRWEHYTLFSWPHLRDFLNEQILVAPVVLPSLLLLWAGTLRGGWRSIAIQTTICRGAACCARRTKDGRSKQRPYRENLYRNIYSASELTGAESNTARFLLIATVCHWLFVWLWNPDYGGQRDWDLFSLSTIPSTLLLVWLLPRWLTDPRLLQTAVWPLILFQALHTAAFIYQNTLAWEWPG